MTPRLIFGREPAAWIAVVSVTLTLLVSFGAPLTDEQTGAVLAVVTAGAALFTAWAVKPVAPALFVAAAKATIALVAAFGLHLDAAHQGSLLAAATVVLTLVLRAQVNPPVPQRSPVVGMTIAGPAHTYARGGLVYPPALAPLAGSYTRDARHAAPEPDPVAPTGAPVRPTGA